MTGYYSVLYQRKPIGGKSVRGTVVHKAKDKSQAIDLAADELRHSDDTESFVILDIREV